MESQADAKFKGLQAWLCRKTGMKQGHLSNLMNGNRKRIGREVTLYAADAAALQFLAERIWKEEREGK